MRALVTCTDPGATSLRAARARPAAPIFALTPDLAVARQLTLLWGAYPVVTAPAKGVPQMVEMACTPLAAQGVAQPGDIIVIAAPYPAASREPTICCASNGCLQRRVAPKPGDPAGSRPSARTGAEVFWPGGRGVVRRDDRKPLPPLRVLACRPVAKTEDDAVRLKIDVELDYATEGLRTALLAIEAAELADQRVVSSTFDFAHPVSMVRVPADEGLGFRSWLQVRDRLTGLYSAEVEIDRAAHGLSDLAPVALHELPGEIVKFLMPSRYCHSDLFGCFVEAEFGGLTGGALVAVMRDWIEENIDYVRGASNERTTATDTFVTRRGICRDYAHLLATFARAANIPARCVSVYAPEVEPPDFHAVAEVYLEGGWRLVDATGMAAPDSMVRIGAGPDASDIPFLIIYGPSALKRQKVSVKRA